MALTQVNGTICERHKVYVAIRRTRYIHRKKETARQVFYMGCTTLRLATHV